jgi:adenylosuccinate synthase
MPAIVVIGTQWGDEGKGKIVDFYSEQADAVMRFQGGNNAGHTVVADGKTFKLHFIPSGIIHGKEALLGNGMVIEPEALLYEIKAVEDQGVEIKKMLISDRAQIILPYHKSLDGAEESSKEKQIGTTKKGIGPAYQDKMARTGLRFSDLLDEKILTEKIESNTVLKNQLLQTYGSSEKLDPGELSSKLTTQTKQLEKYIGDTSVRINEALDNGLRVLFEGAQGTFLDIDHGTYPFVTSSNTVAGGACTGTGVGPTRIDKVIGVVKAYTTRVGEGPFPTEETGKTGEHLRDKGHEFGTTTGRPRRCGWLDMVMLKYASRVNGISGLALTKLDVLNGLETVKICTHYDLEGQQINDFPTSLSTLAKCKPVYEELPGWKQFEAKSLEDFPEQAKNYLSRISELSKLPIWLVSTGPGREETLVLEEIWG